MPKKRKAIQEAPKAEKAVKEQKVLTLKPLNQDVYTTEQVAELLNVTRRMVRYWTNGKGTRQRLRAFKCGKILRITKEDLQAFLESHYDQDTERRAKYKTNPTSRRVDKAIRESQKRDAAETLRRLGVTK